VVPYCRIMGFMTQAGSRTEVFPQLSISLVEYRRPKLYTEIAKDIVNLIGREAKHPIWLRSRTERPYAAYLLPFVTRASNMTPFKHRTIKKDSEGFRGVVGDDIAKPSWLVGTNLRSHPGSCPAARP